MIDFAKLRAPFPADRVSWRVGSTTKDKSKGMALAYIDARDVMERLDETCLPEGWQCKYSHANGKTVCDIGIKVGDEWVWKADGAGDTDVEKEKGALSDAFKRAAVRWGVGRYLYDLDSPWVELEPAGNSYRIKRSELARLQGLLGGVAPRQGGDTPAPWQARFDHLKGAIPKAADLGELKGMWDSNASHIKHMPQAQQDELTAIKDDRKAALMAEQQQKMRMAG